jgi:hypothetical protein|tara:strand:- start:261 stop:500 length:240 start_codon:yes stop_codon:yes gene_type:complete
MKPEGSAHGLQHLILSLEQQVVLACVDLLDRLQLILKSGGNTNEYAIITINNIICPLKHQSGGNIEEEIEKNSVVRPQK